MTFRESERRRLTQSLWLTDGSIAPGKRSLHKLLLYYRAHNMGWRLQHKSFFLINVLVHPCVISNLNYQQVKPRNFPSSMLMNGKLSRRKPVFSSPSSGLVHRAFPIVLLMNFICSFVRYVYLQSISLCCFRNGLPCGQEGAAHTVSGECRMWQCSHDQVDKRFGMISKKTDPCRLPIILNWTAIHRPVVFSIMGVLVLVWIYHYIIG